MKENDKEKIYSVKKEAHEYILTVGSGKDKVETVFVEAYTPDKKRLKELLEHARGGERTMAQFAEDCSNKKLCGKNTKKINPPILSRIMKENDIKRPLKAEIIQALLNNAADTSFVTPANLMRANGLVEKGAEDAASEKEQRVEVWRQYYDSLLTRTKKERAVTDIVSAFKAKGYKVRKAAGRFADEDGRVKEIAENRYDIDLELDYVAEIEDKKGKKICWGFVFDGTEPEDIGKGDLMFESLYHEGFYGNDDDAAEYVEDDVVDKNGKILLRALMDPASMKDLNISFVCQNRFWYNFAVNSLKEIETDSYISVILIQDSEIVSEFTLKNKKGRHPKCLLGDLREQDDVCRYIPDMIQIDGKMESVMIPPNGY